MSDDTNLQSKPLTQRQLAEKFQWDDNFPLPIQQKLYEHYVRFQRDGDLHRAEMDMVSVSDALFWVTLGKPIGIFLGEHELYFGIESATDLSSLAQQLKALQEEA